MKMLNHVLLSLFVLQIVSAQVELQPKPLNGIRNEILVVTCTFSGSSMIQLRLGADNIITLSKYINVTVIGQSAVYRYGPLEDSDGGSVFTCDNLDGSTDRATLDVLYAPELSVSPDVETSLTGTAVFNYTVDANPSPPSPPVVFKDSNQVVDRITISDTSVTFSDIQCRDNRTYTLQSTNTVGSGNVTFSLLVMRSPPIWLVNRIFENSSLISLSEVIIACPEELLSVSCDFSNINDSRVEFTTTFNAGAMTLELSVTPATVRGNSVTLTPNATCTARNQEGSTRSGMFTVQRTISGTRPTPVLGPGEIAGIVIGGIVGVVIIVGIVIAIIIGICCCLKDR